jgi:predicted aspartyl protease
MKRYRVDRIGNLLLTRAAVHGPGGTKIVRLLVDTGSSFTILPVEVLEAVGCDPAASREHARLITGNGIVVAPRVPVEWLNVLGQRIEGPSVVAHTIPFSGFFEGLLGMDILTLLRAQCAPLPYITGTFRTGEQLTNLICNLKPDEIYHPGAQSYVRVSGRLDWCPLFQSLYLTEAGGEI